MIRAFLITLFVIGSFTMTLPAKAELIILATPPQSDDYYQEVLPDIFDFHISYAKQIIKHGDQVLILSNDDLYDDYVDALGADHVARAEMLDIWMRDFTTSNAEHPVMFRYTAEGQGGDQGQADEVQEVLAETLVQLGWSFDESDWLNDGGNFVEDGKPTKR